MTREAWLAEVATRLEPWFTAHDYALDPGQPRQYAVGFPKGGRGRADGQCWSPEFTANGTVHIFVAPTVAEGITAAGVLAHELVHAVVGCNVGHGRPFKKAALRVGLIGRATQAAPGPDLTQHLQQLIADLPDYGHAPIALPVAAPKNSATRMRKAVCTKHPDYLLRMSKTQMLRGMPLCGILLANGETCQLPLVDVGA